MLKLQRMLQLLLGLIVLDGLEGLVASSEILESSAEGASCASWMGDSSASTGGNPAAVGPSDSQELNQSQLRDIPPSGDGSGNWPK